MKNRLAAAFLVALLIPGTAFALEGRVIGPDGQPLAGARLAILGRGGSTVADAEGRFRLGPDPVPPFDLLVSRPDGVALRPIRFAALPASGSVELRVEPYFTQTVTVLSGVPVDLDIPPAAAFTLVGRGDLEQRGPQQLADVLENVPGSGRLEDGHSVVPTLRGLARGRTLILLDEGRVTAERRAGPSATFLDPMSIEEVEIVRGPGTVAFGSDAFGGVVRARTRIPSASDPFTVRWGLDASILSDDGIAGDAEAGMPFLGGGLMIGGGARRYRDYEGPDGLVANSSSRGRGFRAGWQTAAAGGSLRLLFRTDLGRDIGKPATDSGTTRAYYPEENSSRGSVQFERGGTGAWSRLSLAASWDEYRLLTMRDRLATLEAPRRKTLADVAARDFGLRTEAERSLGAARLSVGIDASGRSGLRATNLTTNYTTGGTVDSTVLELSIDSAHREDLGAFASLGAPAGRVRLSLGLRADRVSGTNHGGYFGDRSTSAVEPSGFAAVAVPVGHELELTLQVARGFRDALLSDRYYRGISGRGFITGNPDLKPEKSLQFDLAARWRSGPARIDAYAYRYRIRDLIERYGDGADFYFRNRGEAEIRGLEIEGSYDLDRVGRLEGGVQVLRGEILDDGSAPDDVPARGGFVQFRRDAGVAWWWLARVAAFARDGRPGPTETAVPGYAVLDGGVGRRLKGGLELRIYGRNLLDHAYFATPDPKSVPAPGRAIEVTVRGVFGRSGGRLGRRSWLRDRFD